MAVQPEDVVQAGSESGMFKRLDSEENKSKQAEVTSSGLTILTDEKGASITGSIPKALIKKLIEGEDNGAKRDEDKLARSDA